MTQRLLAHLRRNTVAYVALLFAVFGGGGGYAVAATTSHHAAGKHRTVRKTATVTACASKKTGELFLARRDRCGRGRRKVTWGATGPRGKTGAAGAAGAPAPSIFAAVNTDSVINDLPDAAEKGMTVQRSGVGVYLVTITDPVCSKTGYNVPVATATDRYASGQGIPPAGATPVAFIDNNITGAQFAVHVGYIDAGSFTPADYYFDVQDTCVPSG